MAHQQESKIHNARIGTQEILQLFRDTMYVGFDRKGVRDSILKGVEEKKYAPEDIVKAVIAYINVGNNKTTLSARLSQKHGELLAKISAVISRAKRDGEVKEANLARVAMCFPNVLYFVRSEAAKAGLLKPQFGTDNELSNVAICDPVLAGYFHDATSSFMWEFHSALNDAKKKPLDAESSAKEFSKWQTIAKNGAAGIELTLERSVGEAFARDCSI